MMMISVDCFSLLVALAFNLKCLRGVHDIGDRNLSLPFMRIVATLKMRIVVRFFFFVGLLVCEKNLKLEFDMYFKCQDKQYQEHRVD